MPFGRSNLGDKDAGFPGDQVPTHTVVVRFKGPFDFTYLARTVQRWFEQRRFRFTEERFKDTGKKMKVDWKAFRDIDEFYREDYTIKVEMWNLSSQEIVVNGEHRKILHGMVQFDIAGSIQWDRAKFFSHGHSWFARFMNRAMRDAKWREYEMKIDMMEYRTQDIQTVIKECLNMSTKENAPW